MTTRKSLIILTVLSVTGMGVLSSPGGDVSAMDHNPGGGREINTHFSRSAAEESKLPDSLLYFRYRDGDETLPGMPDSSMILKGSKDGTAFGRMVVEGENMTRMPLDMPPVEMALDVRSPVALNWSKGWERINMLKPLVMNTSLSHSRYLACPWMMNFRGGKVVVFRHRVKEAGEWSLVISNSLGDTVRIMEDKGELPEEIVWDGLNDDGIPAQPGLLYSYTVELENDRGNISHIPGRGFRLPPYAVERDDQLILMFSPDQLQGKGNRSWQTGLTSSMLLTEASSRLNQIESPDGEVIVEVNARDRSKARSICEGVVKALRTLVINGSERVSSGFETSGQAPPGGTIKITASKY